MAEARILVLWDESQLWGLLALRAIAAMGLPCALINSKKIAQGELFRNPVSDVLLVPGGSARLKARALGREGRSQIRKWVSQGGHYLGFCGGAGLALSSEDGLGLCPWQRQQFTSRNAHFFSGAIWGRLATGQILRLPVWWPGRFAEAGDSAVEVLCRYHAPFPRLLPDSSGFPHENEERRMAFPAGQPLTIRGGYGAGQWLLSYAHLETPGWSEANKWLAELLKEKFALSPRSDLVPPLNIFAAPVAGSSLCNSDLLRSWELLREIFIYGRRYNLFYEREGWLPGWEAGVPGWVCSSLLALARCLAEGRFSENAAREWHGKRDHFLQCLEEFCAEAIKWLEDFQNHRHRYSQTWLHERKTRIFGHPMRGGGKAWALLNVLDSLFYKMAA